MAGWTANGRLPHRGEPRHTVLGTLGTSCHLLTTLSLWNQQQLSLDQKGAHARVVVTPVISVSHLGKTATTTSSRPAWAT